MSSTATPMNRSIMSPALNRSKHTKRKRRPTRTPKPSIQSASRCSRIYSPSPYLNRSFQRKKLSFLDTTKEADNDSSFEPLEPLKYSDSDYDINEDLLFETPTNKDKNVNEEEQKTNSRGTTSDLIDEIENLSIRSNINDQSNKRVSIKGSKSTKIKKKSKQISEIKKQSPQQSKVKKTTVRITKSKRVFKKNHEFGQLLVKPLECGSGCPLYCSKWKGDDSVTKLMPLFESEEFSKEENVDNALREFEFHADIYRKGCKLYGITQCPLVGIYGCVQLKHEGNMFLAFVMPQLHCNLAQFHKNYRKLNEKEANKLLLCGLRFLSLLKSENMVHCDIKPENIFLDVLFNECDEPQIEHFVFGDFGCAALKNEEFPYGNLTGTITMWDAEALGKKHGKEDGFSFDNDLYGFVGSLLDGVYGGSIMEELLEEENENWEETEWDEYTDLVRKCRNQMNDEKFMKQELDDMKCKDAVLRTVLMQIAKKRKERMTLEQMMALIGAK